MAPRLQGIQPVADPIQSAGEHPADRDQVSEHQGEVRFPAWLTTREAMHLLRAPSMRATYSWIHRHGIVRRQNGTVCRRDIERELRRKSQRGHSLGTLTNLRAMAAARKKAR